MNSTSSLATAADIRGNLSETILEMMRACSSLPESEDFHYYYNFSPFKTQVQSIRQRVKHLLQAFTSKTFSEDAEESNEWILDLLDDLLEKVDLSLDAAKTQNTKTELHEKVDNLSADFQKNEVVVAQTPSQEKYPSIYTNQFLRPQDSFEHPVDNSNAPFKPILPDWLATILEENLKMYDESNPTPTSASTSLSSKASVSAYARKLGIGKNEGSPSKSLRDHPFEAVLNNFSYEDWQLEGGKEPTMPVDLNKTKFTFVETSEQLHNMARILQKQKEIAVDLEEHNYHSFQGFLCLMQISTRQEDFIVDVLKVRSQIGPLLGPIFASPSILKVFHGADHDVLWLQRDFNIYVVNMFDTGQASRVLEMSGHGLAFLLKQFCNVKTNKKYQLADWRIRPLTKEMLKYAQCDTHYLLYIFDRMKNKLIDMENSSALETSPILEVYKLSKEICLKLYEKELFYENSYKRLLRGHQKSLTPQQTAVLARLYAWRDETARRLDESVGYVLSKSTLFGIVETMPETVRCLRSTVKGSSPTVIRHSSTILHLISSAKEQLFHLTDMHVLNSKKDEERNVQTELRKIEDATEGGERKMKGESNEDYERGKEEKKNEEGEVESMDDLKEENMDEEDMPIEKGEMKKDESEGRGLIEGAKCGESELFDQRIDVMEVERQEGGRKEEDDRSKEIITDAITFDIDDVGMKTDIKNRIEKVYEEADEGKEDRKNENMEEGEGEGEGEGKPLGLEVYQMEVKLGEKEKAENEKEKEKEKVVSMAINLKKKMKRGLGDMLGYNSKKKKIKSRSLEMADKIKSSLSLPFPFSFPSSPHMPPIITPPLTSQSSFISALEKRNEYDDGNDHHHPQPNLEEGDHHSNDLIMVDKNNFESGFVEDEFRKKGRGEVREEITMLGKSCKEEDVKEEKVNGGVDTSPLSFTSVRERYNKQGGKKEESRKKLKLIAMDVSIQGIMEEKVETTGIQVEQKGDSITNENDFIPFDYGSLENADEQHVEESLVGKDKERKRKGEEHGRGGRGEMSRKIEKFQRFTGLEGILQDNKALFGSKPSKSQVYPQSGNRSATFI